MALIICRECGKEISDQAASCPYCGCPVGENQNVQQEEVTSVNLKAGNMKKVLAIAGVVVAVRIKRRRRKNLLHMRRQFVIMV